MKNQFCNIQGISQLYVKQQRGDNIDLNHPKKNKKKHYLALSENYELSSAV